MVPMSLQPTFSSEHDDYRAIIVKAIADRLAEAFAEWLHRRARREWYAPDEQLDDARRCCASASAASGPAFGYPACPDHSEKTKLFDLLGARDAGLDLTESFAMTPAAAVSGIYLAHPAARYFAVGRIGRDQLEDYAGERENPCYKSSGGCDQISRSLRAAGTAFAGRSCGRRTRRQSHCQARSGRSGVGVAVAAAPARFPASAGTAA